ncbi:MAG: hypothetical protein ACJARV_000059 [Candidatus Pseudothioglobus sp.]|jgi:hypothetical protein|tara:strand:- start:10210 stop:10563 length:354 start_codon:yes stop_codon:yes gene_type:complete
MSLEVKLTCPLGSNCEKIVDGVIERCAWYIKLSGVDVQTGKELEEVTQCAIAWQPQLSIGIQAKTVRVADTVSVLVDTVYSNTQVAGIATLNLLEERKEQAKIIELEKLSHDKTIVS